MSTHTHLTPGSTNLDPPDATWDKNSSQHRLVVALQRVPAVVLVRRVWILLKSAAGIFRQQGSSSVRSALRASGSMMKATFLRGNYHSGGHNAERQLVLEERLTLGPKQHLYLIRCGERQLLVGSAGEGALQWMPLPQEVEKSETAGTIPVSVDDVSFGDFLAQSMAPRPTARKATKTRSNRSMA